MASGRSPVVWLLGSFLVLVGAQPASACFGADAGAASTDTNSHLRWAEARDAAAVSSNLASKINALDACGGGDDLMRDVFADLSVVIARHAPRPECYNGDRGVGLTARDAHRTWAGARSRRDVVANLLWKVSGAMACLDRAGQNRLFADLSVLIAQAAKGLEPAAPRGVVWQLEAVAIKDVAPSGSKAIRIEDTQADSKGGSFRITALNDGECAPGQGVPGKALEERFLVRWRFDRDVARIAFPERFDVILSIDGDGVVPCFDLNPYMVVSTEGDRVLQAKVSGARYYFVPTANGHVAGPRTVEVVNKESGLERGSTAMTPMFRVSITNFRGNRGMQLEAQYRYTLASPPPR